MTEFINLKKSNCKNCYKCIRHCPVKSIRFSGNQAHIVGEECILCGQCFVVCPQNARQIVDETELVQVLLAGDAPVYASIAPSFAAYYDRLHFDQNSGENGMALLKAALQKLRFVEVEETAVGATIVKREYERLARDEVQDVIITSCCHTVNLLVEKYYPQLAGYLAPVVTPMEAHARLIKEKNPNAKVVFIGPCLSKKEEADHGSVDAALTFEELSAMLEKAGIDLLTADEKTMDKKAQQSADTGRTRIFPTTGGILASMTYQNPTYTYMTVDGIEECKAALDNIAAGNVHHCLIEMSSCKGSCIGGPIMEKYHNSPVSHYQKIMKFAGTADFSVTQPKSQEIREDYTGIALAQTYPTDAEINALLRRMGKFKPSDELNCGTCGYDTCRAKAVAIFQGKAEINMCLPYLMEKSERFSNNILNNTPNGILVVNEALEVQQINTAAMKMLHLRSQSDVLGEQVIRILDPSAFMEVLHKHKEVKNRRDYLAEYDKYVEQTIVHDKTSGILIAILRDVTDEENERKDKELLSRQTIETADKVVDKQMRIVQEIASLLGETAAETKIALEKLKESIEDKAV